jgi:HPt (histidine-containing phosphotransfer) domain-containing protein
VEAARSVRDATARRGPTEAARPRRAQGRRPSADNEGVSEASSAILDAGALDRLRELDPTGRGRVVERVLQAFEGSVRRLAPQLLAAAAASDRVAVGHVAHTLKSSSASIGAMHVSRLCAGLEAEIREGRPVDLPARARELADGLDAVLAALPARETSA